MELSPKTKEDQIKYGRELGELLAGKTTPGRFKGIRVPWGIYSHRGGEVFMTRIRVPAGEITAQQLIALAETAAEFGSGQLHLTTRQDIQIHQVKLADTIKIMERLAKVGLSPRGGGGNTVRNITACSAAGICRRELFDVRPDALALTAALLN
ncbi:MAG: sulfite reductase, beta subunit (hemoprotein), partial [Kiritimatiellota bacterium]|nr:sulfite reductase, beta subunit (hemoprotein) [Kiritimatiellota bacterium]